MACAPVIVVVSMSVEGKELHFDTGRRALHDSKRNSIGSVRYAAIHTPSAPREFTSKRVLTNGQCTHGSCKDTGSEGQGRCAGRAPFGAGGRSAERGAGVPRLSCSPLNQRTRAVPVLRNVHGRRGLRPS